MAKRIGANGHKKNAAHRVHRHTRHKLPVAAFVIAAIAVAGCIVIGRYGHRLQAVASLVSGLKPAPAQQVVIQGAVQVNPEELLKRSGIVFPVTLEQLKKVHLIALQNASPWIDKIKTIGLRDGKIVLGISERKPIAMLQVCSMQVCSMQRNAVCLVDAAGVCLPLGAKTGYPLPLVSGLEDSIGNDGIRRLTAAGAERMDGFLRDIAASDGAFGKSMTQINFGRAPVARVMLEGSATVVVINENDIAGCVRKYAGLRETIQDDSLQPAKIDLTCRNLAFVTPKTVPQPVGAGESIAKKTKG